MRERTVYTQAFRQQALEKVYSRGNQTVKSVADQLNMNHWTLKNWMQSDHHKSTTADKKRQRPQDHSAAERLSLLMQSHSLDEEALAAFCRNKGIFPHHLKQWREAFETQSTAKQQDSQIRELKASNRVAGGL